MARAIDPASLDRAEVGGGATASRSSRAPTRIVRWRIVSTSGASPSGKNSSSSERARRYGSKAPILARMRSYSDVQRSGMISAAGAMVRRGATPHRQGPKRDARTSTTPKGPELTNWPSGTHETVQNLGGATSRPGRVGPGERDEVAGYL